MDDYHIVHLLVYWGCNNAVILTDDSGFILESKHFCLVTTILRMSLQKCSLQYHTRWTQICLQDGVIEFGIFEWNDFHSPKKDLSLMSTDSLLNGFISAGISWDQNSKTSASLFWLWRLLGGQQTVITTKLIAYLESSRRGVFRRQWSTQLEAQNCDNCRFPPFGPEYFWCFGAFK